MYVEYLYVIATFLLEAVFDIGYFEDSYNTFRACGYCKAAISFFKYCPQVYLNWKRKSTVGWNIHNIMLDFTGGFFSFIQIVIDSVRKGSFDPFSGGDGFNVVKFFLSIIAMFFDLIFLFQHFVLYRHARKVDDI